MKFGAQFLAFFFALSLVAALALTIGDRPAGVKAQAVGLPSVTCQGDTATVTFDWTAVPGATSVWLDLSLWDNGFEQGTFIGVGPLSGGQTSFTWQGILTNLPHVWRVNSLTASGWVTSETGRFNPCGGPTLMWGPIDCIDTQLSTVHFRWAPMTPAATVQYLDLSTTADFLPGTFVGQQLSAAQGAHDWVSVPANAPYFFRVNALDAAGNWHTSSTGSFVAGCAPQISTEIYGSADRLVLNGVDAPVNVRDVGPDGQLGDPAGPTDVVRYNFAIWPGYGGYPGDFGTTVIAGHVDFHDYGLAVFAPLREAQAGDIITYYRADGGVITYQVDWVADLDPEFDWNTLVASSTPESILLITCNGTFNFATRHYDARRAVHGIRIS